MPPYVSTGREVKKPWSEDSKVELPNPVEPGTPRPNISLSLKKVAGSNFTSVAEKKG